MIQITATWFASRYNWDATTGREALTLASRGDQGWVESIAFTSDGKRVITCAEFGNNSIFKAWDAMTGRELQTLKGQIAGGATVAFFPDYKRVLTGSGDGTARVLDLQTGRCC